VYKRFIEVRLREALADTPVTLIVGPRRAGKTTLARKMVEAGRAYLTLDDRTTLDAARTDPAGFIRGLNRAIIDEVQRVFCATFGRTLIVHNFSTKLMAP
jgi:predicted AAA+ superfamily ATPase